MALTGPAGGSALGPPAPLVGAGASLAAEIRRASAAVGDQVDLDPLAVLGERAALAGLRRRGTTSCGGATRLLRAADGWVAVSLARPDDVAAVGAWLGVEPHGDDIWPVVANAVRARSVADVTGPAWLLGLPVAALAAPPSVRRLPPPLPPLPAGAERFGEAVPAPAERTRVIDLSSLWAGPLCTWILVAAGADVVKVESTCRPDGARRGPPAFFDLLHAGQRSVAIDFRDEADVAALRHLVHHADVVVDSARPRALEQLGIDARAETASPTGPRIWLSITAYGRTGANRDRVGFGDDAAVGGGLVVERAGQPYFCADAVADPLTGLAAAAACLAALAAGGRWLLDVALAEVAASMAGPTIPVPASGAPSPMPPRARRPSGTARPIGADTAAVLADFGYDAPKPARRPTPAG
jgi:hypothetical protein